MLDNYQKGNERDRQERIGKGEIERERETDKQTKRQIDR